MRDQSEWPSAEEIDSTTRKRAFSSTFPTINDSFANEKLAINSPGRKVGDFLVRETPRIDKDESELCRFLSLCRSSKRSSRGISLQKRRRGLFHSLPFLFKPDRIGLLDRWKHSSSSPPLSCDVL